MSWNYRLIKDADRIFLAEVYYAQDGSPSMYADLSDVFECGPHDDVRKEWMMTKVLYDTAFTKAILNEMQFNEKQEKHLEFHSEE